MKNLLFKLWILWYYFKYRRVQFANRHEITRWQQRQMGRYMQFLRNKSPYYRALLSEKTEIKDLSVISKKEFMAHFSDINTLGVSWEMASKVALEAEQNRDFSPTINGVTVGLSSGTTGNRGIFLVSPRERAQWVGAVLAYVIGLSLRPRKVGFFLRSGSQLYSSVQSSVLAFSYYDLSRPFEVLLTELAAQQPHILVAQPAVLERIAAAIQAGNFSLPLLEKVISVAEVLEPDVRERLTAVFGVRISEVYQCTEGFLASSCPAGNLHFHEAIVQVEPRWLDDAQTRFHPIITDFTRSSQPIVRYELNDIIHLRQEPCPCGQCTLAIDRIEGRQDDMLVFERTDGTAPVLVFPDFIRRLFVTNTAYRDIEQYQVVQESAGVLRVFLAVQPVAFELVKTALIASFQQYCLENNFKMPQINFEQGIPYRPMEKFRRIKKAYS